jgi:cyclopropane fatty-acyl-phospholipid synthase-like methyltransferase
MDREAFAEQYDGAINSPRMRALYGDSGYFNVGYWVGGIADLPVACDRLVDELASVVPADARTILDVGCGVGGGTRRLMERHPDALVIGANISHHQLGRARDRGVSAAVVMDASHLAVASGSVDAVLAVESPQHFETRADFLAEALRVLRPGGTLSLADMLFRDRQPFGDWMLPTENHIATPGEYATALTAAGFEVISVRDITEHSWHPFCDAMRGVFVGHEQNAERLREGLAHYVVAFARKP